MGLGASLEINRYSAADIRVKVKTTARWRQERLDSRGRRENCTEDTKIVGGQTDLGICGGDKLTSLDG